MSTVEEIKQKLDIAEVISGYVKLQKSGRNFRALCPFHQEKGPSFYVFPERQSWHCFGACQTGGDVFTFIMKKENLPFGQALHLLAQRAGVPLPPSPHRQEDEQQKERLYSLNEEAARFYHQALLGPAGQAPREYLKRRGLRPQSIEDFQLGYAPGDGQALLQHLSGLGYSREAILASGLVGEKDGRLRDLFRHRLIFPIREPEGRGAGLGGRALDEAMPKYLNSPQSPVFDKGSLLYGLDRAKEAIRRKDRAVIVEGYMDVTIAHQAGYTETVATMGLALSEKHLSLLKRLSRNLALALDADAAGAQALFRAITDVAAPAQDRERPLDWNLYVAPLDAELKVLVLPEGKDPDEVILQDTGLWERLISKAPPAMDYLLATLVGATDLQSLREKEALVDKLKPLFNKLEGSVRWGHYLQKLSRIIMVEDRVLASALRSPRKETRAEVRLPEARSLEKGCLALLLQHPELRGRADALSAEYFREGQHREILRLWKEAPDPQALVRRLDLELREYLEALLAQPVARGPREGEEKFQEMALRLKEIYLQGLNKAREELLATEEGKGSAAHLEEMGLEISRELARVYQERARFRLARSDHA
jgi:DNA primase